MVSTYSGLKIQKMGTSDNSGTWGNVTNTNWEAMEAAVSNTATITFASGPETLAWTDTNAAQDARALRLYCSGTSGGAQNLVVPTIEKLYLVENACADAITVKTSAGTGIAVPAGKTMWVYADATNVVDAITHLTSLTLASALPVTSGGTGANTAAAARTALGAAKSAVNTDITTLNSTSGVTMGGATTGSFPGTVGHLNTKGLYVEGVAVGTGSGTVTSVAVSGGSTGLTSSGGPITSSGTITLAGTLAVANGGTGSTTAAGARTALSAAQSAVNTDITTLNSTSGVTMGGATTGSFPGTVGHLNTKGLYVDGVAVSGGGGGTVTSVDVSGGSTGLTTSGGPVTTSGTVTLGGMLGVGFGGTGTTTSTGTGDVVLSASPTFSGTITAASLNLSGTFGLPAGSAAAAALYFDSDTDTGLYDAGVNTLGITTGGTSRVTISTAAVASTLPLTTAAGTAAAPSHTFTSDDNTGMYQIASDSLGFATGGTLRLTVSTTALTSTLAIGAPAGSTGAAGISFGGDTNTGFYYVGSDVLGLTVGGSQRIQFSTTETYTTLPFQLASGTAAAPSLAFSSDVDTGFYRVGADSLGVSTGGVLRTTFANASVTSTVPVLAAAGSAAAPSLAFSSDSDTGIYSIGADSLGVSTGGVLRTTFANASVTSTVPVLAAAGSAAAPSVAFSSDSNTGIYSIGADSLGVSTGGVLRTTFANAAVTSTVPVLAAAGSAAAPSVSFSGDSDTGFYSVAANQLGISVGGTLRLDLTTTEITSTLPFRAPTGSAGSPSYTFSSDQTSGMYSSGSGVRLSGNGTLGLTVSSAAVTSALPFISPTKTPATAGASGTTGEWAWDSSYIYVCTASNTWKRVAIATW